MSRAIALLAFVSTVFWTSQHQPPSEQNPARAGVQKEQIEQTEEIAVRLSPEKSVIPSGGFLQLRVEVWNIGNQDLFICKDLTRAPCTLRLSIRPPARTGHGGTSRDCVPDEWLKSRPPARPIDFARILVTDWVSIPPNHFYGTTVDLMPSGYPELRLAGNYRITAEFGSGGLLATYCYDRLTEFASEVAALPAKSWQGGIQSNTVLLRVKGKGD